MAQRQRRWRRAAAEASDGKAPRTERGPRTLRAILDAAAAEFGERGFHEASISGITRRAGVALGSFYTYFDSKDAVFRALVRDMSEQVRDHVAPGDPRARPTRSPPSARAWQQFIGFVREHKEIYRIIDEAEFVDPGSFRAALRNHRRAHRRAAEGGGGARRSARRRRRGPRLGGDGDERVPGPALRRVGRGCRARSRRRGVGDMLADGLRPR